MPPPYRRNPVQEAADEFYGEPPRSRFFPPIGRGHTGFSSYVSPDYAAQSRMEMDDFFANRDKQETEKSTNHLRRLENRSRATVMPYTEQAQIAAERLRATQSGAAERNTPFAEVADRERYQTNAAEEQTSREQLPADTAYRAANRDAQMEAIQSGEDRLARDKIDPLAYDYHYRTLDPAIKSPKERQRQARNAALRFQNDQPYVQAMEEEALDDPSIRDKYLDYAVDPESGMRLTTLKKDASPKEVSEIISRHANKKRQDAQRKEDRIANSKFDDNRLDSIKSKKVTAMAVMKDVLASEEDKLAAKAKLADLEILEDEIIMRPINRPERKDAPKKGDAPVEAPKDAPKKLDKPVEVKWGYGK